MYKISFLGNFEVVPKIVEYILNNDIVHLEEEYQNGWDINDEIILEEDIAETPLTIALACNLEKVVLWLLEKGVKVKSKKKEIMGPISCAARFASPDICEKLIEKGALDNLSKEQLYRIYEDIYYGKNFKNIEVFEKYGVSVKKYGNNCLRQAVFNQDKDVAKLFLDYGADINYHEHSMVFSDNSTPLIIATSNNDIELCKWLVENGADVTIKSKYGDRPYTVAVKNKNEEMMEYFKGLESEEFHGEEAKKLIIKDHKLSKSMIEFFEANNLKIEFSGRLNIKYIKFYKLEDTVPLTFKRKKYLSLLEKVDNYWFNLLWNPVEKSLYIFDPEHEKLYFVGDFETFIQEPEAMFEKLF